MINHYVDSRKMFVHMYMYAASIGEISSTDFVLLRSVVGRMFALKTKYFASL